MKIFGYILFLVIGIFLMAYTFVYTTSGPDFFIQFYYIITDVEEKLPWSLQSLMNNTVVIDLFSLISRTFDFSFSSISIMLLIAYSFVFVLKYTYLIKKSKSFFSVLFVFMCTFIAFDCNQLRYNLALILTIMALESRKSSFAFWLIPWVVHITFFTYSLLARLNIFVIVVLVPFVLFAFSQSRYAALFQNSEFVFFKSNLLIIPVVLFNLYSDKKIKLNEYIFQISKKFYWGLPVLLVLLPIMAARLIETLFVFQIISLSMHQFAGKTKYVFYAFGLMMFISRITAGVPPPTEDENLIPNLQYNAF